MSDRHCIWMDRVNVRIFMSQVMKRMIERFIQLFPRAVKYLCALFGFSRCCRLVRESWTIYVNCKKIRHIGVLTRENKSLKTWFCDVPVQLNCLPNEHTLRYKIYLHHTLKMGAADKKTKKRKGRKTTKMTGTVNPKTNTSQKSDCPTLDPEVLYECNIATWNTFVIYCQIHTFPPDSHWWFQCLGCLDLSFTN